MAINSGPVDGRPDPGKRVPDLSPEARKTLQAVKKIREAPVEQRKKTQSLTFDRIKSMYATEQHKLWETTDDRCKARVLSLIRRLKCCHVTGIVGADTGSWTFMGLGLEAVWADGSTSTLPMQALHELLEWSRACSHYEDFVDRADWILVGFDAAQFKIFAELAELLPWWLEETGGIDVYR